MVVVTGEATLRTYTLDRGLLANELHPKSVRSSTRKAIYIHYRLNLLVRVRNPPP